MRHEIVGYRKSNGFIGRQLSYYVGHYGAHLQTFENYFFYYVLIALMYGN